MGNIYYGSQMCKRKSDQQNRCGNGLLGISVLFRAEPVDEQDGDIIVAAGVVGGGYE